jgi:hypothetical protein
MSRADIPGLDVQSKVVSSANLPERNNSRAQRYGNAGNAL